MKKLTDFYYYSLLISILTFIYSAGNAQNNIQTYEIKRPDITRPQVPYPYITFNSGDTVLIRAGGCVQTGGKGLTWKKYINPLDPEVIKDAFGNQRTLYISSFSIEGFALKSRLSDYIDRPYVMPSNVKNAAFFLWYDDDNYADNGYWSHDNGTHDQCKGVGDAWVIVKINRATTK